EIVEQHPKRRLGCPRLSVELGSARSPDRRKVAAQRLDRRAERVDGGHPPRSCSTRRRNRHQLHAVATTKNAAAPRIARPTSPWVNFATTTITIASTAYMITVSRNGWGDGRGGCWFTGARQRAPGPGRRSRRCGGAAQSTRCPR